VVGAVVGLERDYVRACTQRVASITGRHEGGRDYIQHKIDRGDLGGRGGQERACKSQRGA